MLRTESGAVASMTTPYNPETGLGGCYKMMVTVGVVALPVCVRRLEFILSNIQTF